MFYTTNLRLNFCFSIKKPHTILNIKLLVVELTLKLDNFIRINGISYKQALILKWFYKEPNLLLTAREAETRLAVSTVSARKNLMYLVEKGYLTVIDLDKKMNGFMRTHNFETLISNKKTL